MDRDFRHAGFGAGFGAGRRTGSAAQAGAGGGYGGGAMWRLSQPPLHPDELAVSRSSAVDTEVAKMIKAFGAPIEPADAKTIGDYLKENYGGGVRRVDRSS